jgi:hypothetical protein
LAGLRPPPKILLQVESRSGSKASVDIIRLGRGAGLSSLRRWRLMSGILSPSLGWFALHGPLLGDLNVLRRKNCSTLCRGREKRSIRRADRPQAAEGKNNQTHRSHVVLHGRVDQLPRAYGNRRCQRRALTGNGLNRVNLDDQR